MIVFSSVTKQFGDNPPSVQDISFEIPEGEFLFLTGHSGSGKTTLLKLLTREYIPSSGDIEVAGTSLRTIRPNKIHHHRRALGVIYQDYRLLPELNVWENIALPLEIAGKSDAEIEERVTDLLELVHLSDKSHLFPAELSGGESQRVGIARALATAPTTLLADEPTGNLDPDNAEMIIKLFRSIHKQGTTIILATHNLDLLADKKHRRIHLENGKLVEDSKPHKKEEKRETVETTERAADAADSADTPKINIEVL